MVRVWPARSLDNCLGETQKQHTARPSCSRQKPINRIRATPYLCREALSSLVWRHSSWWALRAVRGHKNRHHHHTTIAETLFYMPKSRCDYEVGSGVYALDIIEHLEFLNIYLYYPSVSALCLPWTSNLEVNHTTLMLWWVTTIVGMLC